MKTTLITCVILLCSLSVLLKADQPEIASKLKSLPEVKSVDVLGLDRPTHALIHLLDRHHVSPEDFATVIRDLSDGKAIDEHAVTNYCFLRLRNCNRAE